MEEMMIELECPKCGGTLNIPETLREFSCMYCGARLTVEEEDQEFNEEAYAYAMAHIGECIGGKERDMRLDIRKKTFDPAFLNYERRHEDVFHNLEAACLSAPERTEELLDGIVAHLMDHMEQSWAAEPQFKRKVVQEDDKIVLAIFLCPMVGHLELTCGDAFRKKLNDLWLERYPKSPFYLGSYDEISNSFKNKKMFGLCFITTAVCEHEGKPDDCAELTAFRGFRDGWLASQPDGAELIERYYDLAPMIVTMIDLCTDRDASYGEIRDRWLEGCYDDLRAGRMEACKARYTEMVETLDRRFLQ